MMKQARVDASTSWRKRAGIKQVQFNLKPELVRLLDRLVANSSASGRAEIITRLVNEAFRRSEVVQINCVAEGCDREARTKRAVEVDAPLCVGHALDLDYGIPVELIHAARWD